MVLLAGCAAKQSEGEVSSSTPVIQRSQPSAGTGQPSVSGWDDSTRNNDAGQVAVEVQPLKLGDNQDTWEFAVALNTHSVELPYDLTQVSMLRCEQGREHRPLEWEGSPPGGHHRQGVLYFTPLDHPSSFVEIVIRDVAKVPERVFRWEVEPMASVPAPGLSAGKV
jgi:hypothetical protein